MKALRFLFPAILGFLLFLGVLFADMAMDMSMDWTPDGYGLAYPEAGYLTPSLLLTAVLAAGTILAWRRGKMAFLRLTALGFFGFVMLFSIGWTPLVPEVCGQRLPFGILCRVCCMLNFAVPLGWLARWHLE